MTVGLRGTWSIRRKEVMVGSAPFPNDAKLTRRGVRKMKPVRRGKEDHKEKESEGKEKEADEEKIKSVMKEKKKMAIKKKRKNVMKKKKKLPSIQCNRALRFFLFLQIFST